MLNLDARTLLIVEAFVLFLVGGLMLLAALQGRRDRTLLWMSGALLLGGTGFVVSIAREVPGWRDPVIVLSNMLLITGHACVWAGLRVYVGRPVRGGWLLAGAAAWFALCLWPWFLAADIARLLVFSLLTIGYLAAAGRTLWPERREDAGSVCPLLIVLIAHGLFYFYRVVSAVRVPGMSWLLAGAAAWFALCLWPWFLAADIARLLVFSLLTIGYLAAAGRTLWPERREDAGSVCPLLIVLIAHGLFYFYRVVSAVRVPGMSWLLWPDFTVTILEGILFAISLSFGVLILVRARAERRYRHAALHDALTRLPNRRALFEQGAAVLQRAHREGRDMALLMCDLDWFKRINDEHGHDAGDRVLALFADVLRARVRVGDLCARIGGEEFVVLAPDLGPLGTQDLADRIRRALAERASGAVGRLSVSIGIACASVDGHDLDRLLASADRALYDAKAAGRDCVRQSAGLAVSGWPSAPAARVRAAEAASSSTGT